MSLLSTACAGRGKCDKEVCAACPGRGEHDEESCAACSEMSGRSG